MRASPLCLATLCASWFCLAGAPAAGQPIEVVDLGPEKDEPIVREKDGGLPPDTFDRYVFRNLNSSALQEKLEGWLSTRLGEIQGQCQLAPAQADKLKLAGRVEIHRLLDRIASRRREFEAVRRDFAAGNQFLQQLDPLRYALTSRKALFREESLLDKVVQTTLTPEQLENYHRRLEHDSRERRLRLQASLLRGLEEKPVFVLTDEQRSKLFALWAEWPPAPPGPNDAKRLWDFAAGIPAERYQEFLDKQQWDYLNEKFQRSKRNQLLPKQRILLDVF